MPGPSKMDSFQSFLEDFMTSLSSHVEFSHSQNQAILFPKPNIFLFDSDNTCIL